MQKWEYAIVRIDTRMPAGATRMMNVMLFTQEAPINRQIQYSSEEFRKQLVEMGNNGWEMVNAVHVNNEASSEAFYYFKRPK